MQHSLPIRAESDKKARIALEWARLPCSKLVQMLTSATARNHLKKCKEKASNGAQHGKQWSMVCCQGWHHPILQELLDGQTRGSICYKRNKRLSMERVINTCTHVQNTVLEHRYPSCPGQPICLSRALGCWRSNGEAGAVMGRDGSVRPSQRGHRGVGKRNGLVPMTEKQGTRGSRDGDLE